MTENKKVLTKEEEELLNLLKESNIKKEYLSDILLELNDLANSEEETVELVDLEDGLVWEEYTESLKIVKNKYLVRVVREDELKDNNRKTYDFFLKKINSLGIFSLFSSYYTNLVTFTTFPEIEDNPERLVIENNEQSNIYDAETFNQLFVIVDISKEQIRAVSQDYIFILDKTKEQVLVLRATSEQKAHFLVDCLLKTSNRKIVELFEGVITQFLFELSRESEVFRIMDFDIFNKTIERELIDVEDIKNELMNYKELEEYKEIFIEL